MDQEQVTEGFAQLFSEISGEPGFGNQKQHVAPFPQGECGCGYVARTTFRRFQQDRFAGCKGGGKTLFGRGGGNPGKAGVFFA